VSRGQVGRICTCRGDDGRQLGKRCPQLASDGKHGAWFFKVDMPRVNGRRTEMRRRGFPTKRAAQEALRSVLERHGAGVKVDDRETVAEYLTGWVADKARKLKPTTMAQYSAYVETIIIPALGSIPLERLAHEHVRRFVLDMEAAGRGVTTIRRVVAVLRSALADAVRQRRVMHNAAEHVPLPAEVRAEREPWTAAEAVRFLDHVMEDRLGPLFEVAIGTGLRRGEVLALRWVDLDLDARVLFVRRTLSSVNGRLVFTAPKTRGSAAGVGLSPRVVASLRVQRNRQDAERASWGDAYTNHGLVFAKESGEPLRPEYVLNRFYVLSDEVGLPRVHLHDLRHAAATLMLTNGVPLALVSKVLRHTKVSITSDLYGHLTREASTAAVDAAAAALDAAAAEAAAERALRAATTVRPQEGDRVSLD
jgi:integrase